MDKLYRSFWPDVFSSILVFFLLMGQVVAENSLDELPITFTNTLHTNKINKLKADAFTTAMFNACTCKDSEGIIFRYTGESCSASNNNQDSDKTSCSGSPGGDGINISYDGGAVQDVNIGDVVFIGGPSNGLSSETDIQVGGQSITLHTSCSQPLAVGNQFGSLEVVGFIYKDGSICGVEPCSPCEDGGEIAGDEGECDSYDPAIITEITAPDCPKAPVSNACPCKDSEFLIFTYTGGSCGNSVNAMGNDFTCSGSLSGATSVTVNYKEGSANVALGESFQVARDDAKEMTISGGGSQSLELHVSCSQPLNLGDTYGGLTLSGFIYKDGSTCGVDDGEDDDLEYQWISATDGCPDDISQAIAGATSKEYDPPMIDQTTWFVRLARKKDCIPSDQFNQFPNTSCGCKDSETILFKYVGGACGESVNSQPSDKWVCSGDNNSAETVTIQYEDGSATVSLGETFSVERDKAKEITISGGGSSQFLELHVSCSQPINLGDTYGALQIAGFTYKDGSSCELPDEDPPVEDNPWVASNCVVKRVDNINVEIINKICSPNDLSDPFDDTYSFDIVVTGGPGLWSGSFSNPFLGAAQFAPTPYDTIINLGPFPAGSFIPSNVSPPTVIEGGLPIDLTIQDVASPSCQENFTVEPPACPIVLASYGDMVFNDLDGDGVMDAGEPGVSGVTVTLSKQDGTVVGTFVTGNDGKYLFTDLVPNMDYKATFTNIPNGFQFTTPNIGDDANDSDVNPNTGMTEFTTLDPGEDDRTNDAGIVTIPPQPATYGDMVFNDLDRDGIMDGNEPGVQGVLVILSKPDGTVVGTQITGENGKYLFTNLAPNMQYKATFSNIPNDFQFTMPNQGGDDANDSDVNPNTGMTEFTTLDPGEDDRSNDAGLVSILPESATYGDMVFNDLDRDGIMDNGEPGVQGVSVTLSKPDGTIIGTQITNELGKYLFTNLAPNMQYKATFENLPNGFQFTVPNATNDVLDSDVNPNTGMTEFTTLDAGEDDRTWDAGIVTTPLGSIGNEVFSDNNNNGIKDPNEPGIGGVEVKLQDANGNVLQTTTTNANGVYGFDNLPSGNYKIMFGTPTGFNPSPRTGFGDNDIDNNNDNNPNNGNMTDVFFLSSGEDNPTIDAGFTPQPPQFASVGNEVFSDNNNNGIKDPNEPGISGVEVKLQDANGNVLQTTTTNTNGMYGFNNLPSGNYKIMFGTPTGFNPSPQTGFGDNDIDNNNDNNPNNGNMTDVFFLSPGEDNPTIDAGFAPQPPELASVGNEVFRDDNNNGIKDPNESGISGVEVKLQDANGNVLQTTTTNANGMYGFNNLPSGNYKIMFGTPTGFNPSPRTGFRDNDIDNNNDNNPNNGNMTDVFFLSPGEDNPTIDAGFSPKDPELASVGNHVWDDLNENGFKEPGEPGVKGVEVTLLDPDGNIIAVTETDENGVYQFENLPSGFYKVMFEEVAGFEASPRTGFGDNDVDNNSDADPVTHMTDVFFLSPGESNQTIDAGCVKSGGGVIKACKGLTVTASAGKITIAGIKSANTKIEYAGPATGWGIELACDGDCGDRYMINNLSPGDYSIKVQTFDPYCYAEYRVTVPNDGGNPCDTQGGDSDSDGVCDAVDNCKDTANADQADNDGDGIGNVCDDIPNGGGDDKDCNSVTATGGEGKITITNIPTNARVEYAGAATRWALELVCNGNCNDMEMVSGLAAGEYSIKIQTFNPYCYNEIKVNVTDSTSGNPCDTQGGDSDGDGVCDAVDNCKDKANADQADNDGDGIGNVCDDTPNGGGDDKDCNSVTATGGEGKITITNIPTNARVEYAGPSTGWGLQLVCNGNCNSMEMVSGLTAGAYSIKIQTYNPYCYNEISVNVTAGGTGNPCDNQGGDSDGDGICDNVDNCRDTANADQADNDSDGIGNVCDDTPDGDNGTPTDCDKVVASLTNSRLTVSGLGAPIVILKVFDANWENVFECSGDKCPETVIFSADPNEVTCHIDVQFYTADWQLICGSNITVTNNTATSRNAPRLVFDAIPSGQAVEMQWLTNTGWKNERFELERSLDGINFESLQGVANLEDTDEMAYYEEVDSQPALGANYYRLKQVYRDGSFDYTDVKLVNFNIDVNALNIYPNPVESELFVDLNPYEGKQVNLIVTNQFGQTIQQVTIPQVGTAPTSLNMKEIPNGLYQVTIQMDGGLKPITKKILVSRMY